jgi:hypothetical protein
MGHCLCVAARLLMAGGQRSVAAMLAAQRTCTHTAALAASFSLSSVQLSSKISFESRNMQLRARTICTWSGADAVRTAAHRRQQLCTATGAPTAAMADRNPATRETSPRKSPPEKLGSGSAAVINASRSLSDGELMACVDSASSLAALEQLLQLHHVQFRCALWLAFTQLPLYNTQETHSNASSLHPSSACSCTTHACARAPSASCRPEHIAAALRRLPELLHPRGGKVARPHAMRLISLLSSAVLECEPRLDAHQVLLCLTTLTSPACLQVQRQGRRQEAATLSRLIARLVANGGAALRELHSGELAAAAAAAEAAQRVLQQYQQQQQQQDRSTSSQDQDKHAGAQLQPALPAAAGPSATVLDGDTAADGAMLLVPMAQLWPLLETIAAPKLHAFSVSSLATLALAFSRAGVGGDSGLMARIVSSALPRAAKYLDGPPRDTVALLQALAINGTRGGRVERLAPQTSALVDILGDTLAARKTDARPVELAAGLQAFALLRRHHVGACVAASKAGTRGMRRWPPVAAVSLLSSLAVLRHRDDPLIAAAARVLPGAAATLPVNALAEALWAPLSVGFRAPNSLEGLLGVIIG